MKKVIFTLCMVFVVAAMLPAATGDPLTPGTDVSLDSQVSDSLTIVLEPASAENQYIWIEFTKAKVESSTEDPKDKAITGEFALSMTTTDTSATASNDDDTLFISAQFAYSGNADVQLSGTALKGTTTSSTEYIGYTITNQEEDSIQYIDVDAANEDASVTGDTVVIQHRPTDPSKWVDVRSVPLKITTDPITGKTAGKFTGEITATVISAD